MPADASGLLFVRTFDVQVHLDAQGQQGYLHQIIRILRPQALQAGNIAIVWNPAVGPPIIHQLRILRGDQAIDILDHASFDDLRQEQQLEQSVLTGTRTAALRVSDLRVGDDCLVGRAHGRAPCRRRRTGGVAASAAATTASAASTTSRW